MEPADENLLKEHFGCVEQIFKKSNKTNKDMKKSHLIFLHEKEGNSPIAVNAEYMLMAYRNDEGDATNVVQYDYLENVIFDDTDFVVNETPEKIFNMLPQGEFIMLHKAENNHNVVLRTGAIIACSQDDDQTHINLVASESIYVHETPMTIHNIVTTGRQYKTKAKKEEKK